MCDGINGWSRKNLKAWGGYSPKVYDGTFIQLQKAWIDDGLGGMGSCGDNHFLVGSKLLKSHTLYAPTKKTSKQEGKKKGSMKQLKVETKK
jgi:hypothetical protein